MSFEKRQEAASNYLISICDVCTRSHPEEESEDYNPGTLEQYDKVYCPCYRAEVSRRPEDWGMPGVLRWRSSCAMFAPDLYRIRCVMAQAALRHAKEIEVLGGLLMADCDKTASAGGFEEETEEEQ